MNTEMLPWFTLQSTLLGPLPQLLVEIQISENWFATRKGVQFHLFKYLH